MTVVSDGTHHGHSDDGCHGSNVLMESEIGLKRKKSGATATRPI